MEHELVRRSWVEIDLEKIRNNYRIYKEHVKGDKKVLAVVKADAYGHGDLEVATCLQKDGVDFFAVSNIMEALKLREGGIRGEILILGYTPPECAKELYDNDITQALVSEEYAGIMKDTGYRIKCHFAIDSGMNRIGLDADNPEKCEEIIRKYADCLNLKGIFTHLCVADTYTEEQIEFTDTQIRKFGEVAERVKDLNLEYVHYMNSAGGTRQDDMLNGLDNLTRLGIILYGLKPDYTNTIYEGIEPALEWKSVVFLIKELHPGETVSYGRTFRADREMRIATIPTGYADGYNRILSNKGYVLIRGKRAPIIGRVCMDQMMVDVTDIPDVSFGDEVVLLGKSGDEVYTADDMAQIAGTIGYEIVCDISKRVMRKYI